MEAAPGQGGDYSLRFHLLAAPSVASDSITDSSATGLGLTASDSHRLDQDPVDDVATSHDFWLAASRFGADGSCKEVLHVEHFLGDLPPVSQPQQSSTEQQPLQGGKITPGWIKPEVDAVTESRPQQTAKRKRDESDDVMDMDDTARRVKSARESNASGHDVPKPANDRHVLQSASLPFDTVPSNGDAHPQTRNGNKQLQRYAAAAEPRNGGGGVTPASDEALGTEKAVAAVVESAAGGEPCKGTSSRGDGTAADDEAHGTERAVAAAVEWSHRRIDWWSLLLQLRVRFRQGSVWSAKCSA